jgi:hypothetical protein
MTVREYAHPRFTQANAKEDAKQCSDSPTRLHFFAFTFLDISAFLVYQRRI